MASKTLKSGIHSFSIVLFCTIFIISFTVGGSYAYDTLSPKDQLIENNTQVSSISIGNLTKEEAIILIDKETDKWRNTNTVSFLYMDQEVSVKAGELLTFDSETSLQLAMKDKIASLFVTINTNKLEEIIQQFSDGDLLDKINISLLVDDIIIHAQQLNPNSLPLNVHYYLLPEYKLDNLTISESFTHNVTNSNDLQEIIDHLNGFEIQGKTEVSLLTLLEDANLNVTNSKTLSIVATSLYKLILQTNFEIVERALSQSLPDYSELGYDAYVSQDHDFKFYNPNINPFALDLSLQSNVLHAKLIGTPLPYTYKVMLTDEKVFEPKKILRYSADVPLDGLVVEQEGKNGYGITVYREALDQSNRAISKELISEDFYRPTHKIEVRSLHYEKTEDENNVPGLPNPDNDDSNGGNLSPNLPPNNEQKTPTDQDDQKTDEDKEDDDKESDPIKGY